MSFSPFEDFLELSWDSSDNNEGDLESHDEVEHNLDSSFESSLTLRDNISLDSTTLEQIGSMIHLPPSILNGGIQHSQDMSADEDEHTRSTIVSSAASGVYIPPPEESENIWVVSPHPRLQASNLAGISTVCTETVSYQEVFSDASSAGSSSIGDFQETALVQAIPTAYHDRTAFETIADRLFMDMNNSEPAINRIWYSRFTDVDWEQLRQVAKVVLMDSIPSKNLLPLPPLLSQSFPSDKRARIHVPVSYSAAEWMPSSFICRVCNDIVVGALLLDCGCTVCTMCWVEPNTELIQSTGQDGYDLTDCNKCHSCKKMVFSSTPCHAVDVAICQTVETLDPFQCNASIQSMKIVYSSRLELWRQKVENQNNSLVEMDTMRQDKLLALLIQEEEDLLWKKKGNHSIFSGASNMVIFLGQAAVAVLAGTLSSFVLQAASNRR